MKKKEIIQKAMPIYKKEYSREEVQETADKVYNRCRNLWKADADKWNKYMEALSNNLAI